VVAAGTTESVAVVEALLDRGFHVLASQGTDIAQPWTAHPRLEVRAGALDDDGWETLLRDRNPRVVVDAAHPFAMDLRASLRRACHTTGVPRLRLERAPTAVPEGCLRVDDPQGVVDACFQPGAVVVLATGSRTLPFLHRTALERNVELHARLCPGPVAELALECGFPRRRVIWGRGALDAPSWIRILLDREADTLVTKESGAEGGVPAKIEAAAACRVRLVVVDRPLPEAGVHRDPVALVRELERLHGGDLPGTAPRS